MIKSGVHYTPDFMFLIENLPYLKKCDIIEKNKKLLDVN